MSVYLSEEKLKRCPFDPNHKISEARYQFHVKKCSSPNRHLYVQCKYNAGHWLLPEDMNSHLRSCADFLLAVHEVKTAVYKTPEGFPLPAPPSVPRNEAYPQPKEAAKLQVQQDLPVSPQRPNFHPQAKSDLFGTSPIRAGYPSAGVFSTPQYHGPLNNQRRDFGSSSAPAPRKRHIPSFNENLSRNYNPYASGNNGSETQNYQNSNESQFSPLASSSISSPNQSPSIINEGQRPLPQYDANPMAQMVAPVFTLLKPVNWSALRNRETFEPLTKFQIQTLSKGDRQRYHGYLMDWQKWKNANEEGRNHQ